LFCAAFSSIDNARFKPSIMLLYDHTYVHNMLNAYIYHQLPPTCFDVCYTIFRETIVSLAQKAFSLEQVTQWSPWRWCNKHRNM